MKRLLFLLLSCWLCIHCAAQDARIVPYIADPGKVQIGMFWKDKSGGILSSFQALKAAVERDSRKLLFAMNGGMYMEDQSPLGLYIEKGSLIRKLNTRKGAGNFYLQPNGVFYVSPDGRCGVVTRADWQKNKPRARYATQSGPMLLTGGRINAVFTRGSANVHYRNGVGILPDGRVLFAISRVPVNFYDFASYFQQQGCKQALYLDGAISGMWTPALRQGLQGGYGVMIGVVE